VAENQPLRDALIGTRTQALAFEHLDMRRRLRLRAFVGLCMPLVFETLHAEVGLFALRRRGYAPVSFYLDFTAGEAALAPGSTLALDYAIRLARSAPEGAGASGAGRLMFVSQIDLRAAAPESDAGAQSDAGAERPTVPAGSARIVHVLTRPAARAGEHRVETVPEELRGLKEHRWEEPLPSLASLERAPDGYAPLEAGPWAESQDVWGLPNTDVNQHVNVKEYVMGAENQFTRLLHGAGLPVAGHRIARARLLLRKPFFAGQTYALRAALYRRNAHTRMHAGFYLLDAAQPAPRASSFVVCDGVLEGAARAGR